MSPVFRHGGLRLYLLKLLDEAPRHGYDVIRLLQDRFLGVYSPSPGTIYPRLARLEEEGLVTHELIDGKKVYKITDAGREELNGRLDDLADLEDELSASVRDIAREITRDVRETVRSLRDEFTWAVREAGRPGHDGGRRDRTASEGADASADQAYAEADQAQARADQARAAADEAQAQADRAQAAADDAQAPRDAQTDTAEAAAAEAAAAEAAGAAAMAAETEAEAPEAGPKSVWSEAAGESARGAKQAGDSGREQDRSGGDDESARQESQQRRWPSGGWRDWADWADRRDWRAWADWAEQRDWREWTGKQEWKDRAKASQKEWKEWAKASKQEWAASRGGGRGLRDADRDLVVDLERLAAAFARELRGVAWQAEALSEDAVGNLGRILTDALNRIRNEVFRPPGASGPPGAPGSGKEES
ncbi:MAG TPA: helix-turn-helix transcriptional regulator [Streptosporangiaceae bacterium]|nr:helix-turn-helix transcriptional regulator [Streptosporangiaceae bacterium]